MKNTLMLIGLAATFAAITACFGLFSKSAPESESKVAACAGLSGQAKIDCEQRQQGQ